MWRKSTKISSLLAAAAEFLTLSFFFCKLRIAASQQAINDETNKKRIELE